MYRTTPEGRILLANPALVEMLGFDSFEELAVRKLERDETYVDRSRAEFKRMVEEQGEIRGLESAWRRRDGTVVHVRESARVMRGEAGKVLYYEGTVEDITERRTAEAALRESEARFRDLVEHSHELMTTMTLDGTILTVNRAAQQALGLPRERLVGANIRDFLVPRYRDAYQEYVATIRERGEAAGLLRVMTARGEERLWEYRNTVRTESVAEPIVRGLARDVSEEWRARRRLEESEERYRDLVEKAGVAIVVDDVEGRLKYSNRRFAELLGYTEAEIRNIAIERLVHPDDCERVMSTHRAHVSGRDAPWSYRFRGVHRDGRTLHLAVDVTPLIRGDRLAGTRSYIRDETEERLLQEQLLQAQKMETVGRLAGGVAHDFNNVLQVILAHAGVALTDLEKGIATEDHLREIRAAAERAAGLTRQLLAFSRRQEIKPEILDLNELANGMRKMLRRVISEDIEIVVRPEPGLLLLEGDRGGLEQVLLNLAVNARDAMPGGGLLTISTGATAGGDDDGGGQVWLAVADTGCGMDEATRDKIFEPFFTTKDRERGTGLDPGGERAGSGFDVHDRIPCRRRPGACRTAGGARGSAGRRRDGARCRGRPGGARGAGGRPGGRRLHGSGGRGRCRGRGALHGALWGDRDGASGCDHAAHGWNPGAGGNARDPSRSAGALLHRLQRDRAGTEPSTPRGRGRHRQAVHHRPAALERPPGPRQRELVALRRFPTAPGPTSRRCRRG